MNDRPTRVFGLMCLLVAIWIATYWLYKPGEPPVTFDRSASAGAGQGARDPSSIHADPLAQLSRGSSRTPAPPDAEPPHASAPRQGPPSPLSKPLPEPANRVEPPKFRDYTVQQGDTGWQVIAERVYGDPKLWQAVSRANPLVTPNKLIPGRTRLRIPIDPGNIQGRLTKAESKPALPDQPPAKTPPAPAAEPPGAPVAPVEYTIRAEDTLSGIAKAYYGKATLWRTIADANRDRIPDPDRLPVGVKIIIPPR